MNHLNLFNPYENKANSHEDELTRNFLILVKNIPSVQILFFEMVRQEMVDVGMESIATGNLSVEEIHTQISNTHNIFSSDIADGRNLLSIIISDDKFEKEVEIKTVNRRAIYDGVITCSPDWVFIIENKPSKENIWVGQLSPNIAKERDISIESKPCCLSWRDIIEGMNKLVINKMVNGFELQAIEDFTEYVDNKYSWINPYTSFEICKGNEFLLDKRCNYIMENCKINGKKREVKKHRGWKHYIESGVNTIKQIALDSKVDQEKVNIEMTLMAGDTMTGAREVFDKLDVEALLKLQEEGFSLSSNFHVSYRASNLMWFKGSLSLEEYIKFWKSENNKLRQIKKDEFETYFNFLEEQGIVLKEDRKRIDEKIQQKKYGRLNICPGIGIKYSWDIQRAIDLDKANMFEEDFYNKLTKVFDTLGGI